MICPVCEKEISFEEKSCSDCGQDMTIYKRIISASNWYYNDGLEKAKVRDLSGAVTALRKSLRFNKKNTEARNLLGLVYYEMGEVVSALSEWVLSKNFQTIGNEADNYIKALQENGNKLENINQTIKKYNSALGYAKQGNEDLAIMQLEKAVSLNPKFIRSYQLLAMLYMKNGDNKKALKYLNKANHIDKNNTTTLKYLNEIQGNMESEPKKQRELKKKQPDQNISPQVFDSGSYKEEKVNLWPYVNLLIGALLGIAVVYYLIVPTVKKNIDADYAEQFKSYSDQMASQSIASTQLSNENEELKKQVERLESELAQEPENESDKFETIYNTFFTAVEYYLDGKKEEAADKLTEIDEKAIDNAKAKKIYNIIKESTFIDTAEQFAEEGRVVYNSGKYQDAIEILEKALNMDSSNQKAIYFMGRAYHRLGEYEKAREYYNTIVNDYPDSDRASDAKRRLRELPST